MEEKKVAVVVDDESLHRKIVGRELTSDGYTVFYAESGQLLIDNLEKFGKVDLFVIDYEMPGINGAFTILALRRNPAYREVEIIGRTSEPHIMLSEAKSLLLNEYLNVDNLRFVLKPSRVNVAITLAGPRQTVEELTLAVNDYKDYLSKTVAAMERLSVCASPEASKQPSPEKSPSIHRSPTRTRSE